ncbi:MAG: DUF4783 domain-containing protein [Cytophagales bacterium]|nr:DUF4783 domain-containing protein [Cytophagales bacterium]MDW8383939.1 DUF4783 domain-containing protein [Flammeovirgaceae bacterium]
MKQHYYKTKIVLSLLFAFFATFKVHSQEEIIVSVKSAISQGDAEKLSAYFNDLVELNIREQKDNYSKAQAQFVLKSFFQKFPPVSFEYIHQGSSKKGVQYAIGKYYYKGGSFRVYMLIKETTNGKYLINTLDFGDDE